MDLRRRLVANLAHLQAFEAVWRLQGFTRAAAELNLTQSAVSRQVIELETQLGQPLFLRVGRRVTPTRAAERFHPEALALLAHAERTMLRAISGAAAQDVLRIATMSTFGSRWLVPRLGGFLDRHPGIRAELVSRDGGFDLEAEGVDVAIQYGQRLWPGAVSEFLCRETVVPVAAPRLLARHPVERPDALARLPLLQLSSRPRLWADWFAAGGIGGSDTGWAGHSFDRFSLLIEAARAGLGLALLPTYLIQSELASGALAVVPGHSHRTPNAYYLIHSASRAGDPLLAAFRDWILGEISPEGRDPV